MFVRLEIVWNSANTCAPWFQTFRKDGRKNSCRAEMHQISIGKCTEISQRVRHAHTLPTKWRLKICRFDASKNHGLHHLAWIPICCHAALSRLAFKDHRRVCPMYQA
jgi:hypothetical protein